MPLGDLAWIVTGGVLLGGVLFLVWFLRWGERWGATPGELAAAMVGDEWLKGGPRVRVRMTRAVWIDAPAERVWPWIAQMGRGAGWYSYDTLDNGGRRSARHLVSWIPDPRSGDAAAIGYLRAIEPGRELAWWLRGGRFFGAWLRGVMAYRVTEQGGRTRLVARMQADGRGPLARPACGLYRLIDNFMARRQLLGIRERAERFGVRCDDPERPESGARDQYQLYQVVFAAGGTAGVEGAGDAATWRRAALEDGILGSPGSGEYGRNE